MQSLYDTLALASWTQEVKKLLQFSENTKQGGQNHKQENSQQPILKILSRLFTKCPTEGFAPASSDFTASLPGKQHGNQAVSPPQRFHCHSPSRSSNAGLLHYFFLTSGVKNKDKKGLWAILWADTKQTLPNKVWNKGCIYMKGHILQCEDWMACP